MARPLRSSFVLLAFGAATFPPLAAQAPEVSSGIPPGHVAPTTKQLEDANDFPLGSFALAIVRYLYGGGAGSAG